MAAFARGFVLLLVMAPAIRPVAARTSMPATASAPAVGVDDLIRWATDPATDPIRRDAFAAQAVERMRTQLRQMLAQAPVSSAEVLERLRLELKLAEAQGLIRGEPFATRLLHLQGRESDRRRLAELTDEALPRLEALAREIAGKRVVWRGDYAMMVTHLAALEDLSSAVAYKTAWVALYRALAMASGPRRDAMFARAVTFAQPFTEADPNAPQEGTAVTHGALLVTGIARRERGEHAAAAGALRQVAQTADEELRAEAQFQLARNATEHGLMLARAGRRQDAETQFQAARQAIAAFAATAADGVANDFNEALLTHALRQAQADVAETEEVRREFARQAQAALAEFAQSYPDVAAREEFLTVIVARCGPLGEHGQTNALVMLAEAVAGEGLPADERVAMLEEVLAGGDDVAAAVRPAALWHLATLEARRGRNHRAAALFGELASQYGDSTFARPAAMNAVVSYNNLLAAAGKGVDSALRREFIAALTTLLGRWGDEPDVAGWYFDFGWQHEKLAATADDETAAKLLDKAVAAYQAVPTGDEHSLSALRRALGIRADRLLAGPAEPPRVEALVRDLRSCAARAEQADTPQAVDIGAWAELTAAKLLAASPGGRDEALALLAELPARWGGADIVGEAVAFHAAKLLEGDQVDQAVSAVEQLAARHPEEAQALGRRLLEQMRQADKADEEAWVQGRVRLAAFCYDRCAEDAPARVDFALAYAEALLDAGRAGEALELLRTCRERGRPARADVLQAMARAHGALGEHGQAAEIYARLTEGLDRQRDAEAYWTAELGYCRSILAARRDEARAMRSLTVRIAQLRLQDPNFGGLTEQFAAIEAEAAAAGR